jgi:hypothetical protein
MLDIQRPAAAAFRTREGAVITRRAALSQHGEYTVNRADLGMGNGANLTPIR